MSWFLPFFLVACLLVCVYDPKTVKSGCLLVHIQHTLIVPKSVMTPNPDYSKNAKKGVLRNNVDPSRLGVVECTQEYVTRSEWPLF